jgi:hypothetical protein
MNQEQKFANRQNSFWVRKQARSGQNDLKHDAHGFRFSAPPSAFSGWQTALLVARSALISTAALAR